MGRYAFVVNGVIDRCVETDADTAAMVGAVPAEGANVGWVQTQSGFEPPASPEVPPREVTARQAKEELIRAGLDEAVVAAINAISDPVQRKLALNLWEESNDFQRDNGLITQLAPALGLTDAQIDQLFIQAKKR